MRYATGNQDRPAARYNISGHAPPATRLTTLAPKERRRAMIERYTRPEMALVWSDDTRLDTWLRVELLVCEGWAREGAITTDDLEKIRAATYDAARMREIEAETHHDVIAFLRSVQEQLGPEGRFLHLGPTKKLLSFELALRCRIQFRASQ